MTRAIPLLSQRTAAKYAGSITHAVRVITHTRSFQFNWNTTAKNRIGQLTSLDSKALVPPVQTACSHALHMTQGLHTTDVRRPQNTENNACGTSEQEEKS